MSTILVTGANGQLGNEMRNMSLLDDANKYIFTDVRELDITDLVAVQKFLSENAVDFIVNCAAYTATFASTVRYFFVFTHFAGIQLREASFCRPPTA